MNVRLIAMLAAGMLLTGCCPTRTIGVFVADAETRKPIPDSKITIAAYPSPKAKSATRCRKDAKTDRNGWAYLEWPVDYERGQVIVKRVGYETQRMDNPPMPSVRFYLERIEPVPIEGDMDP